MYLIHYKCIQLVKEIWGEMEEASSGAKMLHLWPSSFLKNLRETFNQYGYTRTLPFCLSLSDTDTHTLLSNEKEDTLKVGKILYDFPS